MARRAPRYEILHASGRITTTSAALWALHVQEGNLVRLSKRRAQVAAHLACWASDDGLVFQERNEDGFSGTHRIPGAWEMVIRAALYKGYAGYFPHLVSAVHFERFLKAGNTRREAAEATLKLCNLSDALV